MFSNPGDLPPSTNEAERKLIIETASNQTSSLTNPCLKEQKLSYKCLSENNFNKDKCSAAFANYTACQEFWKKIKAYRRSEGIRPHLPRPEDRDRIKKEYMERLHMRKSPDGHSHN
ncbi:coiled-coil-helix-coiled-coil-helix domain-containing protein 7 [Folsomia candida]|uniref:Coiled-coil-helix-coiled-coil-helix domain-containing protein 7 n=1 Tax=Folsomia candida TaxID=158441 RepID=A0A226F595_FOLCA|nr:coiled-coil-helix-coiled-coil-helix domain-containing protein 7 [Folsomia candida]OXA64351.1 Coiled-coil-helix-coiled-coil-helix domain-containing protein 7 [Folsomia candida]